MKKFLKLFLIVLFCSTTIKSVAFATMIEGGVKYDVDSAREYVQEGIPDNFTFTGHAYFKNSPYVQKAVYTYNNSGIVIGVTALYKGENDVAYIYGRDMSLRNVDKYDRSVFIYPHRGYRYDLNGNLVLTSLTVSKNELFRFTPSGQLLAHSVNGIIYDENGNMIGRAK